MNHVVVSPSESVASVAFGFVAVGVFWVLGVKFATGVDVWSNHTMYDVPAVKSVK